MRELSVEERLAGKVRGKLDDRAGELTAAELQRLLDHVSGAQVGLPRHVTHAFRLDGNIVEGQVAIAHDGTIAIVEWSADRRRQQIRLWDSKTGASHVESEASEIRNLHFPRFSNKPSYVYNTEVEWRARWGVLNLFIAELDDFRNPVFWMDEDRFCWGKTGYVFWVHDEVLPVVVDHGVNPVIASFKDETIILPEHHTILPGSLRLVGEGILLMVTRDTKRDTHHIHLSNGGTTEICGGSEWTMAVEGRLFLSDKAPDGKTLIIQDSIPSPERMPIGDASSVSQIIVLPNGLFVVGHQYRDHQRGHCRFGYWFVPSDHKDDVDPAMFNPIVGGSSSAQVFRRLDGGIATRVLMHAREFDWFAFTSATTRSGRTFPLYSNFVRLAEVDDGSIMSWYVVGNTFYVVRYI